jgi:nucleoid-associated protein YgaU
MIRSPQMTAKVIGNQQNKMQQRVRFQNLLPLLAWVTALLAAIAMLLVMGKGRLGTPSVLEPAMWPLWARGREPLSIAFSLLRLLGLAVAWYLLGVTTMGVLARAFRWARLVVIADVLTVAWVRHLLQSALGLGLATAAVTGATMNYRPTGPAVIRTTIMAAVPLASVTREPASESVAAEPATQAAEPVSYPLAAERTTRAADPLPPALGFVPALETSVPQASADTYVVRPGDHFWTIAEQVIARAWGRAPTEAEIMPFWQQLVEVNRSNLIDPGNADLILPGQALTIPASPIAP